MKRIRHILLFLLVCFGLGKRSAHASNWQHEKEKGNKSGGVAASIFKGIISKSALQLKKIKEEGAQTTKKGNKP